MDQLTEAPQSVREALAPPPSLDSCSRSTHTSAHDPATVSGRLSQELLECGQITVKSLWLMSSPSSKHSSLKNLTV